MTHTLYERPTTVSQAVSLLSKAPDRTVVLAGGTDLMLKIRSGTLHPDLLVDVKSIPELTRIQWLPDGELAIGAAVTMCQIYRNPEIKERYPALSEGAEAVGSLQIRHRATVGGNICNASPCMDTAPGLLLLGAKVIVAGPGGQKTLSISDFFVGVKKTRLAAGELVCEIRIPATSRAFSTAFDKIKRVRGHDLALVNAAVALDRIAGTIRVAVGSCGATTIITDPVTDVDPAGSNEEIVTERVIRTLLTKICPIDDVRSSAEYRRDMAELLCRRLVKRLISEGSCCGRIH